MPNSCGLRRLITMNAADCWVLVLMALQGARLWRASAVFAFGGFLAPRVSCAATAERFQTAPGSSPFSCFLTEKQELSPRSKIARSFVESWSGKVWFAAENISRPIRFLSFRVLSIADSFRHEQGFPRDGFLSVRAPFTSQSGL